MKKFDYKKWIVENKYGKLNEQTATCYACSGSYYQSMGWWNSDITFPVQASEDNFYMVNEEGGCYISGTVQGSTGFGSNFTMDDFDPEASGWMTCNQPACMGNIDQSIGWEGCGGATESGDNVEPFADNEWDPSLEGCGNFDNLPEDIQQLACQAYANLGDTNNPSLTTWVQNGNCCTIPFVTGSMAQGMPSMMNKKQGKKIPTKGLKESKMKKSELRKLIREIMSEQFPAGGGGCSGLEEWLSTESGFAGGFSAGMTVDNFCSGCADEEINQGPGMNFLMDIIQSYPGDTLGSQYFNFIAGSFNGNDNPCSCCGLGAPSSPYFAGEEEPPAAASMGTPMAPPLPGDIPGQPPASHKSLKNKKIRKTRR